MVDGKKSGKSVEKEEGEDERSYVFLKDGDWLGDRIGWGTWWIWVVLAVTIVVALIVGWIGAVTWPGTRERLASITRCSRSAKEEN